MIKECKPTTAVTPNGVMSTPSTVTSHTTIAIPRYLRALILLAMVVFAVSEFFGHSSLLDLLSATTINTRGSVEDVFEVDDLNSSEGLLTHIAKLDPNLSVYKAQSPRNTSYFVSKYCDLQGMSMADWYPNEDDVHRRAPAFMLIGAKKSGTTSLTEFLDKHPNIIRSRRKELLFFLPKLLRRNYTRNGRVLVKKARQHFLYDSLNFNWKEIKRRRNNLSFDATPGYIFHSAIVPQYVFCVCPWVKVLVILRDPVDRFWSHYNFLKQYSEKPSIPIEDWVTNDLNILKQYRLIEFSNTIKYVSNPMDASKSTPSVAEVESTLQIAWGRYTVMAGEKMPRKTGEGAIGRGIYCIQLFQWFKALIDMGRDPTKDLLIVHTQDLSRDPQSVLDRVHAWLGLPPHAVRDLRKHMVTNYTNSSVLNDDTRRRLETFYAPFNKQLSRMLSDDSWDRAWDYSNHTYIDAQAPFNATRAILAWPAD